MRSRCSAWLCFDCHEDGVTLDEWTASPPSLRQQGLLVCPHCSGARRLLAAVTSPESIAKVLQAMGLSATVPMVAAARAPPGGDAEWYGA